MKKTLCTVMTMVFVMFFCLTSSTWACDGGDCDEFGAAGVWRAKQKQTQESATGQPYANTVETGYDSRQRQKADGKAEKNTKGTVTLTTEQYTNHEKIVEIPGGTATHYRSTHQFTEATAEMDSEKCKKASIRDKQKVDGQIKTYADDKLMSGKMHDTGKMDGRVRGDNPALKMEMEHQSGYYQEAPQGWQGGNTYFDLKTKE